MTKKDLESARAALRAVDSETIADLESRIDALAEAAQAATCETADYGEKLTKIRAHCTAMKDQLKGKAG
jgi:uncharacterized tellurite resistance protein B-like protein